MMLFPQQEDKFEEEGKEFSLGKTKCGKLISHIGLGVYCSGPHIHFGTLGVEIILHG